MATGIDLSKLFRIESTTAEPSQHCTQCHKIMVMCSCSHIAHEALPRPAPSIEYSIEYQDDDTIFDVDCLDIENVESQPDFGPDVVGHEEACTRELKTPPKKQTNSGSELNVLSPMCDKSKFHRDFIDVDTFSIDQLPPLIRHHCTYVWLRNCIPLVVRLVRNVTATGRACLISDLFDKTIECTNSHCKYSPYQHMLYGGIGIITNKHVVRDNVEAAETKVEFFYNSRRTRSSKIMVVEYGTSLHTTNKRMDYTIFTCFVHSKDLISLVATFDKRRNCSWLSIPKEIRDSAKKFAIVISHPHGASKKISIGDFVGQKTIVKNDSQILTTNILRSILDACVSQGNNGLVRLSAYIQLIPDVDIPHTVTWYTTPTCKGSSGAPVYMANTVVEYGEEINQAHTHRGVDDTNGHNNCFT